MMVAWVGYVSVSSALSCQKQGVWVSGIVRISLLCVFKPRLCVLECEQEPQKSDRAAAPQPSTLVIAEHVARADARRTLNRR
jgi:hypothetical protein